MRSRIGFGWITLAFPVGMLLTLIFYSYSAGFISVSCDEFAKAMVASRGLDHPSQWFSNVWMPLHLGMIAVTSLITGDLFLGTRLISMTFGVLLVIALWGVGRQLAGIWGGAALAAILGATHPLVVLLSGTGMVDICYVATLMLGVSFYLRFSRSAEPPSFALLMASGFFTLSCAFHYNAWIATLLMVPLLLRDLFRGRLPRPVLIASLTILGSVPCAWVAWNWAHTGNALAFFSAHSGYSAKFWAHNGWHPSPSAAVKTLAASIGVYSPLMAILTFAGIGTLFAGRSAERRPWLLWLLLIGFLTALVFLYATGGRPAAFEPRYVLFPSVLMISIASAALLRLGLAGSREVRAFIAFLSLAAVVVNVSLCRDAVEITKQLDHYGYTAEARKVASRMHGLRYKASPRMVLEIKAWNFLAMPVFLGRDDAIVEDRAIVDDSVRHFENRSMLLGDRDPVLTALNAKGVGFIAAWSPEVRNHIEPWGLPKVAQVDSYTIFRIPGNLGRSQLASKQPLAPLGGAPRR